MNIGLQSNETDFCNSFHLDSALNDGVRFGKCRVNLFTSLTQNETGEIMDDWDIDEIIRRYLPNTHNESSDPMTQPEQIDTITYANIQETYELMANIVTEHGEEYLPIFERLHDELEGHLAKKKLLSKAFKISNKINEPKMH